MNVELKSGKEVKSISKDEKEQGEYKLLQKIMTPL